MPARPAWRAATIIAAVPVLAAMLLAATDTLAPAPALALAAASAGWGLLVGSRWKVDEKRREAGHAAEFDRVQRAQAAATAALQQRLETERAITEALPDPLIVLGADRQVIRVNPAAQAAFGTEMGAVLRHPGLRAAIERSQNHPAPQTADLTLPVPVERDVHATVFALDQRRVAAVLSDRTRERALERMRADFVANASHELRTPLASLIGFIDTLRGPAADDPPAQIRFLGIMAEQAARMNRLIDDLLSLSRIELNEHQTPTTRLSLPDLLHRMAASFEPRVRERGITLDVVVPDALPAIAGDEDQLDQVLQNLLDNAVKYGREGGVVRVTATAEPPGGRWPAMAGVSFSVADDGAGIQREHIPRLTERFYRVDKGRSRAVGGTGLGLAIVKHIVSRHRGQLAISSREGEGATFTVWLPAARTQP